MASDLYLCQEIFIYSQEIFIYADLMCARGPLSSMPGGLSMPMLHRPLGPNP